MEVLEYDGTPVKGRFLQIGIEDLANAMLNSLRDAGLDVEHSDIATVLHTCVTFAKSRLDGETSVTEVPIDGRTEKLSTILVLAENFLMDTVLKDVAEKFIAEFTRHPDSKEAKESSFGIWDNKLYVL